MSSVADFIFCFSFGAATFILGAYYGFDKGKNNDDYDL
jgi:hypothetical protein